LRVFVSVIVDGPLILAESWTKKFSKYKTFLVDRKERGEIKSAQEEKLFNQVLLSLNKDFSKITSKEKIDIIQYVKSSQGYTIKFGCFYKFMVSMEVLLSNFELRYYIYTLGLAILSIYYKKNIFFSLQLLDIIKQFEALKNVIRAVTKNSKQLILTFILQTLTIYLFSMTGFFTVASTFYMSSIYPSGESTCSTAIQCFLTVFSLGPRSSGGVGDVMLRQSYSIENRTNYMFRWIYDLLAFIVINIIGMNILFGIILDTFSGIIIK